MTDQTPGTDWQAKHNAAGTTAHQPHPASYTIADGTSVNTREHNNHPMGDDWLNNRLEQTT